MLSVGVHPALAEDLDCIPSTLVKLTTPLIPAPWRLDTSEPQEKV